jgi:hypothetical protein
LIALSRAKAVHMAIETMRNSTLSQARTHCCILRDRGDNRQPPKGGSFTSPAQRLNRSLQHSLLFQQLQSYVMSFGIRSNDRMINQPYR